MVVVLNDNGMSISPNVGALERLPEPAAPRAAPVEEGREAGSRTADQAAARSARRSQRSAPQLKESLKAFMLPPVWEELDWPTRACLRHDVHALRKALRDAFAAERPSSCHIATVRARASPARGRRLEGMEKWHAPRSRTRSPTARPASIPSPRRPNRAAQMDQVFGEALGARPARRRVVGITAAMNSGTGLNLLQKAMPDRYFDVGIAEQQAVLFAAGLALQGTRPVAAIYSTFLQRAFDQIVHDVCLQKLPVVFAMDRAGLVGDDGPTHHGVFDIAYLRCLPNIVLAAPRDEAELVHLLHTALQYEDGPMAIRYPRGAAVGVPIPAVPQAPADRRRRGPARGRAGGHRRLRDGSAEGLGGRDQLAESGLEVTVADARWAKPIDAGLMAQLAAEHDLLVTVEEGVLAGGFGTAVWETLSEAGATAAHAAHRPARPVRHPRLPGPAARGSRLHRASHRAPHRSCGRRPRRDLVHRTYGTGTSWSPASTRRSASRCAL
jgi:1-deoxy-D-xylulose-5-phosphate synthase